MSLLYADSSALVGAYLPDEADHAELRALVVEGADGVVTSELARLEVASAATAAMRRGRIASAGKLLARFEADCEEGLVTLLALQPEHVLPRAYGLILDHRLRTLDAVHLAVALNEAPRVAGGEDVVLLTRDEGQAAAARALGLAVR